MKPKQKKPEQTESAELVRQFLIVKLLSDIEIAETEKTALEDFEYQETTRAWRFSIKRKIEIMKEQLKRLDFEYPKQ